MFPTKSLHPLLAVWAAACSGSEQGGLRLAATRTQGEPEILVFVLDDYAK